jgi:hypothetical protein
MGNLFMPLLYAQLANNLRNSMVYMALAGLIAN